jgi:hypothetical protein
VPADYLNCWIVVDERQDDIKYFRGDTKHVNEAMMISRALSIFPSQVDVAKFEYRGVTPKVAHSPYLLKNLHIQIKPVA